MFPKNYYYNPLKTVAGANFPLIFPPIKKALDKNRAKSELKIKEYLCQVSSKSLENCDL